MEQSGVVLWPRFQFEVKRFGINISLDSNGSVGTVVLVYLKYLIDYCNV